VLKEAKPEKRQPFSENNSMAVLKDANRGPTVSSSASRCPSFSSFNSQVADCSVCLQYNAANGQTHPWQGTRQADLRQETGEH